MMVPGAYWLEKLTVVRGIGLAPPGLKKLAPPPMMSRESYWACAGPAPASKATAKDSKANDRIISAPLERKSFRRKTGHNRRDFASNEAVSARLSNPAVKTGRAVPGDGCNA